MTDSETTKALSSSGLATLRSIQLLTDHPTITFHLTGSRFFGGYSSHSDWDFFTEFNASVVEFLVRCGFRKDKNSYETPATVYYHQSGVHVQLVDSSKEKLEEQRLLSEWGKLSSFDKLQRARIWKLAELVTKTKKRRW